MDGPGPMKGGPLVQDVTVSKQRLIEELHLHREAHEAEYQQALVAYRIAVLDLLRECHHDIREGGKINLGDLAFRLPEPVAYTNNYDHVIAMLAWEMNDTIVLTPPDFTCYVLDEWPWSQYFAASTRRYL